MGTPSSASTPYCTAAQFVARKDWRTAAQLLSDNGRALPDSATVQTNTTLTSLLQQASGMVEAAATVGERYVVNTSATPVINDLAALTGNSAALLQGLVADLTMWLLWIRRPEHMRKMELPAEVELAFDFLDKLRNGERVFGILENMADATVQDVVETPADVEARHGAVVELKRLFGRRGNDRYYYR